MFFIYVYFFFRKKYLKKYHRGSIHVLISYKPSPTLSHFVQVYMKERFFKAYPKKMGKTFVFLKEEGNVIYLNRVYSKVGEVLQGLHQIFSSLATLTFHHDLRVYAYQNYSLSKICSSE